MALVLAAAAAAVMVWTNALQLGSPAQIEQPGVVGASGSPEARLVAQMNEAAMGGGLAVTFQERDAQKWKLAQGHQLERYSIQGGDVVFARLSSPVPLDGNSLEWPSQGLSLPLPVEANNRFNGKILEVGIVARASSGGPTHALSVVYATRQAGNSGWQSIPLGTEFELKTLRYKVPLLPDGYTNPPVLVIHSDPSGAGGKIDLLGVYLRVTAGD